MFWKDTISQEAQEEITAQKSQDQEAPESTADQKPVDDSLVDCQTDLKLLKDKFVRLGADFQNYKVRIEKDRVLWMDKARSEVLYQLLKIVDDFDRALAEAQKKEISPELQQWLVGFELIHKALYQFLKSFGVEQMEEAKMFDATLHEAVTQIPSPHHKKGEIVDVMERGFMHKGNVFRIAKVIVAQ